MSDIAIGIDLGTTNTCVALYRNGEVKILENAEGKRLTPSCVFFKKQQDTKLVGKHAKSYSIRSPKHGTLIYEIKRFMGRNFTEIKDNLEYFSFEAVADNEGKPIFLIECKNGKVKRTPEEISALILSKIKKDVENKLGCAINKAVITVPAYYSTTQREATFKAAERVGFTVLKLFNEPTAAALSYYFQKDFENDCHSLVYDLGGGTFDVSILKRSSKKIDIIGVDGDTHLGGKDFDNLIVDYVCKILEEKYNYNPKQSKKEDMFRLQNMCEKAKKILSYDSEAVIELKSFVENCSDEIVEVTLTRHQFNKMALNLIKKTIDTVKRCLDNCNISKYEIADVILAGGSSRIPKIQEMLSEFFEGKTLNQALNFDECVAEGAALQAAMLSQNPKQKIPTLKMTDVVPLSLGYAGWVDKMIFVINRNTPIPVVKTISILTAYDQQKDITIRLFEGERLNAAKNSMLECLTLENLTPAPPTECEILVTLSIDENSMLQIKAQEKSSGKLKELNVNYIRGLRNDNEVRNTVTDAMETKEEDERFLEFATKKDYLLRYCEAIKYNLRIHKLEETHKKIRDLCEETRASAEKLDVSEEQILNDSYSKIFKKCDPLVKQCGFKSMPGRM